LSIRHSEDAPDQLGPSSSKVYCLLDRLSTPGEWPALA
jgi:hypothetical protein